jgi:hypothetical protein
VTTLVHPSQPWVTIEAKQSLLAVARTYLVHGIDHILFGIDHLLFVLGLLLIVRDRWMLVKTITRARTCSSSGCGRTLRTLCSLGGDRAPASPVDDLRGMRLAMRVRNAALVKNSANELLAWIGRASRVTRLMKSGETSVA